jgi:hypothetical protein
MLRGPRRPELRRRRRPILWRLRKMRVRAKNDVRVGSASRRRSTNDDVWPHSTRFGHSPRSMSANFGIFPGAPTLARRQAQNEAGQPTLSASAVSHS